MYRVKHDTIGIVFTASLVHEVKARPRLWWGWVWPVGVTNVADLMSRPTGPADAAFSRCSAQEQKGWQQQSPL